MWTDEDENKYMQLLARRDEHVKSTARPVEVLVAQMFPMASFDTRTRLVMSLINRASDIRAALKPFDLSQKP